MRNKYFSLLVLVVGAGCAIRKNLETPFLNPENKPRVEQGGDGDPTHGTDFCKPQPDGTFDAKTILMKSGLNYDSGAAWAIGGGCVLRPIREVWAVMNNLNVMKFEAVNDYEARRIAGAKAEFTHAYEITYFKSTIAGDIDWTIQWYHGIGNGTFAEPESININYQRTRGTSNISVWGGGIVLTKVTESVTSISLLTEFKARLSNDKNVTSAEDIVTEIIRDARVGAPDWKRLENPLQTSDLRAPAPRTPQTKTPANGLKIECAVADPETLVKVFDLKKGAKIRAIANGDKTDMTIDGEDGLKDFPAKLNLDKETSKFGVGGEMERDGGKLIFNMSGTINGEGGLSFQYDAKLEGGTHVLGSAKLENCTIVH